MSNHEVTIEGDVVRKRYLRTDRGEPEREWSALVTLAEHAPGLAPRPIRRESLVIEMSLLPGAAVGAPLTSGQTQAMTAMYRALFAVPVPPDLPVRHWNPAAFLANNVSWLGEEAARAGFSTVVGRALEATRRWHDSPPTGIDTVRDPVLAQGDGNVDNLLWDGDRCRLVDFEASGVGDLSFEIADLAEHISARLTGVRDPDAVVACFDLDEVHRQRVSAYRIALATFWLLMLLPGNPGHERNPAGSAERQAAHLLTLLA